MKIRLGYILGQHPKVMEFEGTLEEFDELLKRGYVTNEKDNDRDSD